MIELHKRIDAFAILGSFLNQFSQEEVVKNPDLPYVDDFFDVFNQKIETASLKNGWFTRENIIFSINQWACALTKENLKSWMAPYSINTISPKTVAVITAGNIPMVGFHDFLSVLLCGHKIIVKQSSADNILLPVLANYLQKIEPYFKNNISFTEEKLQDFDAVIATGSNNTARYFEFYFKSKPHIIRKNRNSVAILTGNETSTELEALGEDIFRYFGLGCRNVSKLYVPEGYNFDVLFKALYNYKGIINYQKYANNYDYNKAVYLMSRFAILDNGFFVLKEDSAFSSPIATLFYETYTSKEQLQQYLKSKENAIQCIVAKNFIPDEIPFGATQMPKLEDYADGVDIVNFLLKI